jgi:hypothetical protein
MINERLRTVLCIECKRVDAGLAWVFFKSDLASLRPGGGVIHFIQLEFQPGRTPSLNCPAMFWDGLDSVGHLAMQVPVGGERQGATGVKGGSEIESACDQAVLGTTGFASKWVREERVAFAPARDWLIFPLVVTSARLFMCDVDLSQASVETGSCDLPPSSFREVESVLLQHTPSLGRLMNPMMTSLPGDIAAHKEIALTRSVVIARGLSVEATILTHRFAECRDAMDRG